MPASAHRPIARWLAARLPLAALLLLGAVSRPEGRTAQVALLIALLATLAVAADRLVGWLLPAERSVERVLDAGVLAVALAVLPATVLGHLGTLTERAFFATIGGIALLVSFLPSRRRDDGDPDLAGPARGADEPPRGVADDPPGHTGSDAPRIERAIAAFALAAVALLLARDLGALAWAPPGAFNYDDLGYHLPAAALWRQTHDLSMLKFAVGDPSTAFFPLGAELVDWMLLAPFAGSDAIARFAQLPFALGCLAAVAVLARRLGVRPAGAALAVLATAAVPRLVPELALSAGNDLSTACFALAGAGAALAVAAAPTWGRAVLLGTCLGLLVGSKYIGLLFAATILALLLVTWLAGRSTRAAAPPAGARADDRAAAIATAPGLLAVLAVAAATAALLGGYTYLRNWIALGNPVFPQEVSILGLRLWRGWPWAGLGSRQQWADAAIEPWRFLWDRRDLFGPWSRWTLLPAALVAPLLALLLPSRVATRDAEGGGVTRTARVATFLLPATLFAEFLYLMHDHRDLRYIAAGVGFAAVAFAWCVERLPARGAWLVAGGLAVAIAGEMALRRSPFAPGIALLGVATLLALAIFARPAWLWPALRIGGGFAVLLIASIALLGAPAFFRRYSEERERQPLFAAQAVFERTQRLAVRSVAYVGGNQPYPFFGSRLQQRVEIVPTAGAPSLRLYGWRGSAKLPYGTRAWRTWSANLKKLAIDAVVVVGDAAEAPERAWIAAHPERFERLANVEAIELWRVLPSTPPARRVNGGGR